MKRILFPIDLNSPNKNAFFNAVKLSIRFQALLVIYTTVDYNGESKHGDFNTVLKKQWHKLASIILGFKKDYAITQGSSSSVQNLKFEYKVEIGNLWEDVVDIVKNEDYNLIVISRPKFYQDNAKKAIDVITNVISRSTISCLVVPESHLPSPINRITCAADIHALDDIDQVSKFLISFASKFSADLKFLYVIKNKKSNPQDIIAEYQRNSDGKELHWESIINSSVAEGVSSYVNEKDVDLLVLIKQKRNYLTAFFRSSLTKLLIEQVNKPLLILD